LIFAAIHGYEKIVVELINNGANIDLQNNYLDSALMKAATIGHKSIATLLIEKGANLNFANKHSRSALILSTFDQKGKRRDMGLFELDYEKIAETLVLRGADVDLQDIDHRYDRRISTSPKLQPGPVTT
jgi:Ankyrin repeats (many copies)